MASITITLTREIDGVKDEAFSKNLQLTAPDWKGAFTDLPRDDGKGNEYTYLVNEEPIDGYAPDYSGGGFCGYVYATDRRQM